MKTMELFSIFGSGFGTLRAQVTRELVKGRPYEAGKVSVFGGVGRNLGRGGERRFYRPQGYDQLHDEVSGSLSIRRSPARRSPARP